MGLKTFLLIQTASLIIWYWRKKQFYYVKQVHNIIIILLMNENHTLATKPFKFYHFVHSSDATKWTEGCKSVQMQISCTVCLISNTGCLCMTLPDCCVMTVTIFCLYLPEALGLLLIYQKPVPGPGPGPVNTQFIVYSLQCTRLCSSITANIFTLLCLRSLCPLLFFKTRKNYMNFLKCLYWNLYENISNKCSRIWSNNCPS